MTTFFLLSSLSLLPLFAARLQVARQPPPIYNSSLYWNVDTGPVHSTELLTCDFDSDCCWASTTNSSTWYLLKEHRANGALLRTFNLTDKSHAPSLFIHCIASSAPELVILSAGKHLATILALRDQKRSVFRSCSFCAQQRINVTFRYWVTPFVTLEVCWHDAFFGEQLENELHGQPNSANICQIVEPTDQPGPAHVEFIVPPATIVEIVFIVSNKRLPHGGGMVILDDLSVSGQLCGETRRQRELTSTSSTTQTTVAPDPFEQLFGRDFAQFLNADFTTLHEDVEGDGEETPNIPKTLHSSAESKGKLSKVHLTKVNDLKANATTFASRGSPSFANASSTFRKRLLNNVRRPVVLRLGKNVPKPAANLAVLRSRSNSSEQNIGNPCATPGSCTFESGACNYTNSRAIRTTALFRVFAAAAANTRHSFGVTGVADAAQGNKYIRAETKGGDLAVFEADVDFKEETVVAFDVYEAASGQQLSACCFKPGQLPQQLVCPFNTNLGVSASDRTWQAGNFTCQAGTTKIVFMCENFGRFLGICALDDIQLYRKTATGLEFRCD